MKTWRKVARFHLTTEAPLYMALWYLAGLIFAIVWVVFASFPASSTATLRPDPGPVMGMIIAFAIAGFLSTIRSMPFALALGVSRQAYYTGTALLAVGLPAIYGLLLVILQVVEDATNGWGIRLEAFRAPWILQGPWYQSWWTFWATMAFGFLYGMWAGIVYWRWRLVGVIIFSSVQIGLVLIALVVASERRAWHSIWHFLAVLGATGLTDFIAVLAIILLIAGLATVRRITV